ncbi:DNA recombination protein RmuC, partial [Escherichia coli]|nr:DNA recombination protein RmuC [Escherichia coli]
AAAADLGRAQIELASLKAETTGMESRFAELAHRILGESQKNFLDRADQRFAQAGESNEAKMKALLAPVQETLLRYQQGLNEVEKER